MKSSFEDLNFEEQTACLWDALNRGDSFTLHSGLYTIKTKTDKRIVVEDDKGKRYPITIYRINSDTNVGCHYDGKNSRRKRDSCPAHNLFMLIEESMILDCINANNPLHKPCGILELLHKGFEIQKNALVNYLLYGKTEEQR